MLNSMSRKAAISARLLLTLGVLATPHLACDRGESTVGSDVSKRQPAPAFDVKTLDGDALRLADFKGKVVLVNFWATWCGPCRMEIPELAQLQRTYKDQGLVVVGMSLDSQPADYVRTEARRMGADYPIVLIGESGAAEWGSIVAIPTTFVIDRQGRIERTLQGYTPIDRLADLIRPLLRESGPG